MKIKKLILKGYKRFDLLGADTITYTPESAYQLTIGKNGVGKSSLFNELSPLPCEPTDLKEEGYKEIHIEHRGHVYQLRNTLYRKLNSSFIRDGIELNEGGTTKAQKDLVWEHFQYDSNLHDILMGNTVLTQMTPQVRREWFVKMSKSDISYAIGVYNKLKGADRDIKGALKLNNQRLVAEKNKLPSQDDISRVKRESDALKLELNQLLPNLDNLLKDKEQELMYSRLELEKLGKRVIDFSCELTLNVKGKQYNDINELTKFTHETNATLAGVKESWNKALHQLAELQDIVTKQQQLTLRPINVIENEINENQQEINQHVDVLSQLEMDVGEQVNMQVNGFETFKSKLVNLIVAIPNNPRNEEGKRLYNHIDYNKHLELFRQLKEVDIKDNNKLSFYQQQLKALEDVHDVNCPCCQHLFKPGVDRARIDKGKIAIKQLKEEIDQNNEKIKTLIATINAESEWINAINAFNEHFSRYRVYQPLYDLLIQHMDEMDNQYMLLEVVNRYQLAINTISKVQQLETHKAELIIERERRIAAEGVNMEFIYNSITKLEADIQKYQLESNELNRLLTQAKAILANNLEINQLVTSFEQLIKQHRAITLEQVKYMNNEKLKSIILERQSILANNEQFVNRITQSENVIQQLEITNKELEEEQKNLQILTTLLSPQDGLIAESLIGFLNRFLDNMVNVLDQVWSYSMRPHLDLGEDGVELDYRFPVDINEGDIYVKDVSKLSRGQKEIVDFVFKLLLMQYLHLNDYPLIMDEVGGSFDDLHRDRLYRYVKLLVESNQVQQVFIISHIASSHDALTSADKIVLNPDATMVDNHVNRVIQFE